jgi:hypothetical protein
MFLAGIIKTHADTQGDTGQAPEQPAADESPTTLDANAVANAVTDADAAWPSFKPRLTPGYFGRVGGRTTGNAEPLRARWA